MRTTFAVLLIPIVGVLAAFSGSDQSQRQAAATPATSSTASQATERIVGAARVLLKMLDDAGRSKVQFPFEGPQKTRWSNLPSGIFERQGLRLGDLGAPQKIAVMHLLATALDHQTRPTPE